MRKIWKIDYNNWKKNWKIQTILTNMRDNRISTGGIMKRYEVQIEDETFVIGMDTVDDECIVCLLSPVGLTQSEEYFGIYTQQRINQIYENIDEYATPENEVYKKYAPEKP